MDFDRAELDRWLRERDYTLITREQARIFDGPGVVPWDEHRRALAKVEVELDAARARVTELEATGRTLAAALAAHRFDGRDPVVAALVEFHAALDAAPAETSEQLAALEAVAEAARKVSFHGEPGDLHRLWEAVTALDAVPASTGEQLAARLTDRMRARDTAGSGEAVTMPDGTVYDPGKPHWSWLPGGDR